MKNKKHIRFLASLEMTAKQKERKKCLAAAKPPLNTTFSHAQRVMSTEGRHLYLSILGILGLFFMALIMSSCVRKDMKELDFYIISDIDGNQYRTLVIDDREWMVDHLRTTRFNDGTAIPYVTDNAEWGQTTSPAYCWYDNDISNKDPYGALCNGYVISGSKSLAPDGWRVATDGDWKELERFLGMNPEQIEGKAMRGANEGAKLKEASTGRWINQNEADTNEAGLTIIPGGRRDSSGKFYDMGTGATIWTSSETSASCAYYRHFATNATTIGRNPDGDKKFGLAVRCIRIK